MMPQEKQKKYTREAVWEKFEKRRNKVEILLDALDIMQGYNGQSKTRAVASSIGIIFED